MPALACAGCATIDLGDNIVPPDLQLDEDTYYCVIEPMVIAPSSCAGGGAGEGGMCHTTRSSLRLTDTSMITPPECDAEGRPIAAVPPEYTQNFQAVQFTVQTDPLSSPFYRRPTGLDSHPRVIFDEASTEAGLIRDWIAMGGL